MTQKHSTGLPSVAIIIVNWNGYTYTQQCLQSLNSITYSNIKIILVDNASEDNSVQRLTKEFPHVIFHQNPSNLGFTGGNNAGFDIAHSLGSKYIMLLNNDTKVNYDFLEPLVNYLEQNETCAAVQPKIFYLHNPNLLWNAGGRFYPWLGITKTIGLNKTDSEQYNKIKSTDWISGCCILFKSKVIKEVGLFDDNFFAYYEDVDLSLRIKKHGFDLAYIPESKIYHVAGAASKSEVKTKEGNLNPIIHYYDTRNHLYLLRKHHNGLKFLINLFFQSTKISAYCIYFILRGRWNKLSHASRGFCEGFKLKTNVPGNN
jgi:GT2 family glycosyltransferase